MDLCHTNGPLPHHAVDLCQTMQWTSATPVGLCHTSGPLPHQRSSATPPGPSRACATGPSCVLTIIIPEAVLARALRCSLSDPGRCGCERERSCDRLDAATAHSQPSAPISIRARSAPPRRHIALVIQTYHPLRHSAPTQPLSNSREGFAPLP